MCKNIGLELGLLKLRISIMELKTDFASTFLVANVKQNIFPLAIGRISSRSDQLQNFKRSCLHSTVTFVGHFFIFPGHFGLLCLPVIMENSSHTFLEPSSFLYFFGINNWV